MFMDPRIRKLAKVLINYSCEVKKGEKVLIECMGDTALKLVGELIRETYKKQIVVSGNLQCRKNGK